MAVTYKIYSLERPDWLLSSGLSKGIYHDRNALNMILSAGKKVRFRQSHPHLDMGVTLNLLNDDREKEHHAVVTTQWGEIVASHTSVLFLTTPYTDSAGELVSIEVDFVDGGEYLPICQAGLGADKFFRDWNLLEAEFALYISDCAMILIPAKDKAVLWAMHQRSGLQSLAAYYDGIFEHFNYLAGLSFNPTVPTDKNIPNRYFMKADKSGPGAAYYGWSWTAESKDSVAEFWLNIDGANWGSIHEIGHGYEGLFRDSSSINLREVWNNVFAASYQLKVLGDEFYRKGWLYASGEERLYTIAMEEFDKGTVGNNLALTLYFFLLIFGCAGDPSMAEFHKRYRRLSNEPSFRADSHPAMDLLSDVTIDKANVDTSEFMSFASAPLTLQQTIRNSFSNAVPVYPLYLLVKNNSLKQIQAQLGLRSPVDLVSCSQLSITGLTASITINFDGILLRELRGKSLLLGNGQGMARVVEIKSATVIVSGLSLGVYALQLPSVRGGEYQSVRCYAVVRDAPNEINCSYVKKDGSYLVDQVVSLGGLYGVFCRLDVQVSRGRLLVDVVYPAPHSLFEKEVYARITVKNVHGDVVFFREMLGEKTELYSTVVAISTGFTIEVMHREPSRLFVSSSLESAVIDRWALINELVVTEQGLVNVSLGTNAGENLRSEIDKCTESFYTHPHLVIHDEYPVKQDLRRAINTFAEPVRSQLFERYRKIEFVRPPVNHTVDGWDFTWYWQGNGGRAVGYLNMQLLARTIDLVFYAGRPHSYFASTYLSVMVKSEKGEIIYLQEFRGDVWAQASHVQLPLVPGSEVSVMHREATRSWIVNNSSGSIISVGHVQHVQIGGPQRLNLSSYWPVSTNESDTGDMQA